MAYPSTTILPPSPSRISDPVNFVNESALYLQNLPNFRTQFNALTAYINTKYPNYNNYGTVVDSNPVMPTVATFATGVSGTGVAYISSIDTFYENLYTNSSRANSYGAWIDSVMTITGTGSTDTTRAQVPAISAAATRSQTRTAFNTSSILFTETAIKSVRELASAFNYINTNAFGSFDNGLVTAAIDATDDYGRFKATYLDGTKNLDGTYTLSVTQTTNDIVLQDSVTSLFTGGLEGVAYDFNDLSTLFQDAAGTIPVTGAGQPVGLVLDKSKGLVLSDNILPPYTDPSWVFSAGISYSGSSVTFTNVANGGTMVYSAPSSYVVGDTYIIEWDVTQYTSGGGLYVRVGGGVFTAASPTVGHKKVIVRVVDLNAFIQLAEGSGNANYTISNLTVKKLHGNHAYQTTSASRPLLQRNATTGAYYLAFDGTDDYLVTNSINFTATDKISLFAGVRKLSDSVDFPMIAETGTSANDSGSFHLYANSSTTSRGYAFAATGATQVWRKMTADYASPDSAVITAFANLSATGDLAVKQRRNGVNQTLDMGSGDLTGGGNFSNRPLYIGRRAGTSLPFNGHIYAMIIVGKLASDGDVYEAEKILADRVGILV